MTQSATPKSLKTALLVGACLSLIAATAQAQNDPVAFDIEAQDLGGALTEFGIQSGQEIYFVEADVRGKRTAGVEGEIKPSEALEVILNGTQIPFTTDENGTVLVGNEYVREVNLIRTNAPTPNQNQRSSLGEGSQGEQSFRLAQEVEEEAASQVSAEEVVDVVDQDGDEDREVDEVVATGTNIRGISADSSPSLVFTKEDIEISGVSTLPEFIRTLPQSFGGGAQSAVLDIPNDDASRQNPFAGSSINLRGIGTGTALVLLNGKRLAPSGGVGGFVDISMIPLSAIDRIEIVSDGASAIYGADAVSGVVNIVLRDDYTGVETFAGFGSDSGGDVIEYRAGASFGRSWSGGNLIASYEYSDRDALDSANRDFASDSPSPNDLLPKQKVHSGLVTISQDIGSKLSLQAEITHAERSVDTTRSNVSSRTGLSITRATGDVRQTGVAAEAVVDLGDDWQTAFTANYSRNAGSNVTDEITSGNITGSEQSSNVLAFTARADGPLFNLPGGTVLAAVGAEYREEDFLLSVPAQDRIVLDDERDVTSFYAELFVPLFGETNKVPGLQRLELNLAGRQDSYSDFGDAFSPKIGVVWEPIDNLLLRSSYSESFNAPNLGVTGGGGGAVFIFNVPNPASPTGVSLSVVDFRGPELGPEVSTSWTAGIDYSRRFGDGEFKSSISWYDISYVDRIGSPGSFFGFLRNPDVFGPLITANPDPSLVAEIVNDPSAVFRDLSGGAWASPGDEEFLLDGRTTNLASQDTSGIDVDLSYDTKLGSGDLRVEANAAYIIEQVQRITPTAASLDVIDTIFRPVDFKFRTGANWTQDQWTLAGFVNYVDSYTDDREINGPGNIKVDAWTTFDVNLTYRTNNRPQNNLLNNISLALAVRNLFDAEPPSIEGAADNFGRRAGYDPANADPLGRFVTLTLRKEW